MTTEEFQILLKNQANSKPKLFLNLGLVGPALVFVGLSKSNPSKFERKLILSAGIFTIIQAFLALKDLEKT